MLTAAGAMARRGVLVRRLDALEALAHVDEVFFDKTGTLTEGDLHVTGMVVSGRRVPTPDGLPAAHRQHWHVAAALASQSHHPLSRSLVRAAQDAGGWPAIAWRDVREHAGKGIEAIDALGKVWRLGAPGWVLGDAAVRPEGLQPDGDARVWLGAYSGGVLEAASLAGFVFDEVFRDEAQPALRRLAQLGCQAALLSGDHHDRVVAAARLLAAPQEVRVAMSQATPEDKLEVIAAQQASGHRVAVVGDGINDAPVLAKADVSIALDQGAALAQSQADLIVLGGHLLGVPQSIDIARRAMRVVKQNLAWAVIYNLACVPLALAGLLPPWLAGLGMAISSLVVVLNALRLGSVRL
jgi:Cu2+-exporting ATPase